MSIKINEVSFTAAVGAEGHINVTQTVLTLIPSLKAEQISIDKRVYEDNDGIIYDEEEGMNKKINGDIVLDYKAYGNKEQQQLEITAIITHR
jgi:hypothetical protein